jgi:hypothetical protein
MFVSAIAARDLEWLEAVSDTQRLGTKSPLKEM